MAPAAPAAPATTAAASPMVVTEQGRVSVGRRPVGVSWIGQEHLLVTSPSQVILYSIHDGGVRLREWSFRPSKATAFSSPALAASQQGLLLGIQGQRRLVAWPDKASLTAAGAAGPEAMQGVEVGFPVSRLVAAQGPAGVAWCVGAGGQLACFSTAAAAAAQPGVLALLGASSNVEEQQHGSPILAALPSRRRPLLLVARADGSVSVAAPATKGAGQAEEAAAGATAPLCQYSAKALDPPSPNSELLSSGLMWAGGREDSAYYWTVWSTPAGVRVRVARVSIEQASSPSGSSSSSPTTMLSLSLLYGKDLGGGGSPSSEASAPSAAAAAGRKRRRASVSDNGTAVAGTTVEVAGLEGEGALLMVDRARGVLQVWDAEHGVVLGEAAVVASAAENAASAAASGDWIAGEGGVLAEMVGEKGEVAVWRAEARDGDVLGRQQGGLRRVLGKGAVAVTGPAALGKVLVFSGGEWVEAAEDKKGAAGSSGGNGRKGKAQPLEEDEVEALLRCLAGQEEGGDKQQGQGQLVLQDKKWGKPRGPLARTPVSARTALLVARRCLEEEDAATPATTPALAAASRTTPNKRRKNGKGGGDKTTQQQQQAPLWRLLGALLDAGRLPLRERPFLMEELLEKGRVDLVRRVLSGPADVPERALVRCLQRALLLPRGPVAEQEQQEGQGEGEGGRVAGLLELVALAVRRPCCPAFLRVALAAEVDGLVAALLLVLLKVLLERAVNGGKGGRARPSEEQCLTWLEALLDANFVNLVLEGTAAGSGMLQQQQEGQQRVGGTVRHALEGMKALALEAAGACQALETVGGYVTQFRRAGHAMEVIPDYSVDRMVI